MGAPFSEVRRLAPTSPRSGPLITTGKRHQYRRRKLYGTKPVTWMLVVFPAVTVKGG